MKAIMQEKKDSSKPRVGVIKIVIVINYIFYFLK